MKTIFFSIICLSCFIQAKAQETNEVDFSNIVIFPNPTSEILFLRNGDRIESYRIHNLQGILVQEGIQNAQIISLIDLPIGVYFLEMKIGEAFEIRRIEKK